MKRGLVVLLLASAAAPCAMAQPAAAPQPAQESVSEIVVVAPSTVGGGIDKARLGFTVETVKAEDFAKASALSVTEGLQRRIPGVNVSDTQGNPFAGDLNFRGFEASALQGTPQGLAVYMNGQRINEAFGDTVNWDLIPQVAISRADIFTNNPTYGLNALGGAVAIRMKDGFSAAGLRASVEGGSFGGREGSLEGGFGNETFAAYGAIDAGHDDGWRPNAASDVTRGYGDLGWKVGGGEIHLLAAAARTKLGVVGPTPLDLLQADRKSIFTFPQTTNNTDQLFALNAAFPLGGTLSVQGGLHARRFAQDHLDGNDGNFERCSGNAANPLFNTLCLQDDDFPVAIRPPKAAFQILNAAGAPIPCPAPSSATCNTTPYGTLDRTRTRGDTWGGSAQLASTAALFGRRNNLTIGVAYDDSTIHFSSNSTLAVIDPSLEVLVNPAIPGNGQIIHAAPAVGYGPTKVDATNRAAGLYAVDVVDLTDQLSLTLGGRWNRSQINTRDLTGLSPDLTGNHRFSRFNPAVSLAFRATPNVTLFGGYSEGSRAPTPLELGCSDPNKPCLIENALVSDPPLKQVTSKSFELGARGGQVFAGGRIGWSAALFRTDNHNDIISLASALAGRGFFTNVPQTRRQGFEGQVDYSTDRWSVFAGYSFIDATYRFDGVFASPNNPSADADGDIQINKGDHLGAIPPQRFKAGVDVNLTSALSVGLDANWVSKQYLAGDEGNDNAKLPAYWVANLNAGYKIGDKVSLFGRVDNLFNKDYETFGTYFGADGIANVSPAPLPANPDERTLTPAAPRRYSVGLRVTF